MHLLQILTRSTFILTLFAPIILALPPSNIHRGFPLSVPLPYQISSPSPPHTHLVTRRNPSTSSCAETCGTTCYYQTTIDTAVAEGYSLYQSGQTEGSDKYPHEYNDYEGFSFAVPGPYYEFPILRTFKAYEGGSPGADRVVFNTDGELAGVITHTGAGGNDFVECVAGK
ncbi:hypothetical protein HRR83_003670 [Exophiala dermatitidis]|uniref:ribonuclease T1 n=2 Tax=Exophiala dermatitidis TaxID=5970 RepID=H6BT17_EXODN|nr:ribonuclease T1 [Exophiala dermatitidis NIH/UT8656]KAJ4522365.1 hypothetical protein HRR74_002950 [Exophiala dermatitidis]EHY53466.1 ribonuclease T1 [Exophiala dermatitidis NIH/UT8656]KAJ4529690.1 hypothetical protein HRR73_000718 [Exophiala dermatitidis]KAJ4543146.1 hypothetical protein HRR77_005403 [Exophiala dermatitidis]KAJ4543645.1 hypothetical protein HRR76_001711 [Exophiala dermatitidis]